MLACEESVEERETQKYLILGEDQGRIDVEQLHTKIERVAKGEKGSKKNEGAVEREQEAATGERVKCEKERDKRDTET